MLNASPDPYAAFMDALAEKNTLYGLLLQNPVTAFAEMTAASGFDFAWLDMEHTPMSFRDVDSVIPALNGMAASPSYGCVRTNPTRSARSSTWARAS